MLLRQALQMFNIQKVIVETKNSTYEIIQPTDIDLLKDYDGRVSVATEGWRNEKGIFYTYFIFHILMKNEENLQGILFNGGERI